MRKARLYSEVLDAAFAFYRLRLWEEIEGPECFALVVPGEEHPFLANVMGQEGLEYGLTLTSGPGAFHDMRALVLGEGTAGEAADETSFMSFSMTPLRDIPPDKRGFFRKARFEAGRNTLVPFFLAKDANRQMRELRPQEVPAMLWVLKGVLQAHSQDLLKPRSILEGNDVLTLVVGGDPLDPEVRAEFRTFEDTPTIEPLPAIAAPAGLEDLPRLAGRWLVGYPTLPAAIEGEERSVRAVVVADEASELVMGVRVVYAGDIREAAQAFFGILKGEDVGLPGRLSGARPGLPSGLVFTSKSLFDAVAPPLNALGVVASYQPRHPLMDELVEELQECLSGDERGSRLRGHRDQPPAATDLEGWKEIERSLLREAAKRTEAMGSDVRRALARYFGAVGWGFKNIAPEQRDLAVQCFGEWRWLDYRPTPSARTVAEQMLAGRLSEAQRAALAARTAAHPSLYKIVQIRRGRSLSCVDVLLGGTVEVSDIMMSKTAREGWCIPMRVFRAGSFNFAGLLGPVIVGAEAAGVIDFLAENGLEFKPASLAANAHLFGHLWRFLKAVRKKPPRFTNLDGDQLVFHTATYRVTDGDAARQAIARRADIRHDDSRPDIFTWTGRPNKPHPGGETITLASLRFEGARLLLEANSAARYKRARKWLDTLPGVKFEKVKKRSAGAIPEDGGAHGDVQKAREKESVVTPALRAALRENPREYYLQWLDLSLPVFGGKTPRQMCATAEGKALVAAHIRAIPTPSGSPDVPVPVEEMLRELGVNG